MSRAFVREDDRPEPPLARPASALPEGAKNYITADGLARLREELRKLVEEERPPLLAATDDPDSKRRLLSLEQRRQSLEESLLSAEVPEPRGRSRGGPLRRERARAPRRWRGG